MSKYERYEREAELRWGHTDAYKESMRRATDYTPEEWEQLRVEGALVEASLLSLMRDGVKPDSVAAMDAAEGHRQHICKWFYNCSYEVHRSLGERYVADGRFNRVVSDRQPLIL